MATPIEKIYLDAIVLLLREHDRLATKERMGLLTEKEESILADIRVLLAYEPVFPPEESS